MSHETETEFEDLARALQEHRPNPEPEFTDRLDQAVADHFPPQWADEAALGKKGKGGIGNLTERFRRRMGGGRKVLLSAMAGFAGLLLVATVVVGALDSGRLGGGGDQSANQIGEGHSAKLLRPGVRLGAEGTGANEAQDLYSDGTTDRQSSPAPAPESTGAFQLNGGSVRQQPDLGGEAMSGRTLAIGPPTGRDVAREAEITLGTDPSGVQDVANEIVSVTDDHNGIVMNLRVIDGRPGKAGATFDLLIPSGQLESTVADLSGIADLRSRSQELTDITAPTNRAEDQVADSKAKIKSLLGELEETYDETERANLERRIRWERSQLRWAETRLKRLERRADYTPVGVRVETGDSVSDDGSGSWGISDAVDDAGKMLGVAAGVTLIALAVAIPIGIVVLIALAINRAWVRRARRKVLDEDR